MQSLCLPHGMFKTKKESKREKNTADSGTSWTLCRSAVPWRCTTRFRPADRLCLLEMVPSYFPIPCPRQGSEGEKSRPLDHMRQIPFVGTLVPPYSILNWDSAIYLYHNVAIVSSMWYILKYHMRNDCSFDGLLKFLRKFLGMRWLKIILMSIQQLQTACSDLVS